MTTIHRAMQLLGSKRLFNLEIMLRSASSLTLRPGDAEKSAHFIGESCKHMKYWAGRKLEKDNSSHLRLTYEKRLTGNLLGRLCWSSFTSFTCYQYPTPPPHCHMTAALSLWASVWTSAACRSSRRHPHASQQRSLTRKYVVMKTYCITGDALYFQSLYFQSKMQTGKKLPPTADGRNLAPPWMYKIL